MTICEELYTSNCLHFHLEMCIVKSIALPFKAAVFRRAFTNIKGWRAAESCGG